MKPLIDKGGHQGKRWINRVQHYTAVILSELCRSLERNTEFAMEIDGKVIKFDTSYTGLYINLTYTQTPYVPQTYTGLYTSCANKPESAIAFQDQCSVKGRNFYLKFL